MIDDSQSIVRGDGRTRQGGSEAQSCIFPLHEYTNSLRYSQYRLVCVIGETKTS